MGILGCGGDLFAGATVTALPAGIVFDGLAQASLVEIGPQGVGKVQFGVGNLPQQEVADATFAAGTDEQVRRRQLVQAQPLAQPRFVDLVRAQLTAGHGGGGLPAGLHDVPAAAIAHRHVHVQRLVAGGLRHRHVHALAQGLVEGGQVADEAQAHAMAVQFVHFLVQRAQEQSHQRADLVLRPLPVFAGEGKQGQYLHTLAQTGFDHLAHRLAAGIVAETARAMAGPGPAPVAVHHDGDVPGNPGSLGVGAWHGRRDGAQSAISSSSLALTTASTSLTARSVSFWISSSTRRSSSSVMSFSLSRSLTCCNASRRTLRIAILAFSPSWPTCLASSLRRSSVSAGMFRRITVPAVVGVMPMSEAIKAFSIGATMVFSHGVMMIVRESASDTDATCDSGMSEP